MNVLAEPGGAVDAAVALAERICANAPLPVQACLRAVNGLAGAEDEAAWSATAEASQSLAGTDDLHEGLRAFFEKRPPAWQGR